MYSNNARMTNTFQTLFAVPRILCWFLHTLWRSEANRTYKSYQGTVKPQYPWFFTVLLPLADFFCFHALLILLAYAGGKELWDSFSRERVFLFLYFTWQTIGFPLEYTLYMGTLSGHTHHQSCFAPSSYVFLPVCSVSLLSDLVSFLTGGREV